MHLYFMTRGIKQNRDIFVSHMQSQFFQWKRKNKETGEDDITMVQGALRPIELWEYVFPEESLGSVLAMLGLQNKPTDYAVSDAKMALLRRALKCGKIPKMPEVERTNIVSMAGMGMHGIGIKKDIRDEIYDKQFETTYEQEML